MFVFCRSLAQFITLSLKAKAKRNAWQQSRTIMDGFHSRDEGPCGKRNYLHSSLRIVLFQHNKAGVSLVWSTKYGVYDVM